MPSGKDPFTFVGETFEERYPVNIAAHKAERQRLLQAAAPGTTTALLAEKKRLGEQIVDLKKRMQTRPPSAMQQAQERAAVGSVSGPSFGPIGQARALQQMPQMSQVPAAQILTPAELQQAMEARKREQQAEITRLEQSIVLGNQKLQQNPGNIALKQSVEAAQSRLLELNAVDTNTTLESAMPAPGSSPGWF